MKWLIDLLTSSIGRKLLMSLTGLFLITFLAVHLIGNLQLLADDQGASFNAYAKFMTGNPIIKTVSYGLYFFILLHTVQGIALWRKNRAARDVGYAVKVNRGTQSNAKIASSMGWLGSIIAVFIGLHMYQFWYKMHWELTPGADGIKDLYGTVSTTYQDPVYVAIYVVSMIVIGFHLWHGFQSAFTTLGLTHRKYTPLIDVVGKAYAVLVPLGFAAIPIWMYMQSL